MENLRNYFGIKSSSFILAYCLTRLMDINQKEFPSTVRRLRQALYVDDVATSLPTSQEAMMFYREAKTIFGQGSFVLRKWLSNDSDLMEQFKQARESIDEVTDGHQNEFKVLGLKYYPGVDKLSVCDIQYNSITKLNISKIVVLSAVAQVYDRLGFLAPLVINAKVLLQKLWKKKIDWKSEIEEELKKDFRHWLEEIRLCSTLQIPRKYTSITASISNELHVFTDASGHAMGAVAYIVQTSVDDKRRTGFILAKSRVAPIKNQTIPRLELMALVLGAEIVEYLRKNATFEIKDTFIWVDSSPALFQATSKRPEILTDKFVRNRVLKIQKMAEGATIRFVPTKINPADIVSRGCTFLELEKSIWFTGPSFLTQTQDNWPQLPATSTAVLTSIPRVLHSAIIFRFERFSNWKRLTRSAARFLRAVNNLKGRNKNVASIKDPLTVDDIDKAERFVIHLAQREVFAAELAAIEKGDPVDRKSPLARVSAILRDKLLCVGGRLAAHDGSCEKHPVFISPNHPVARLILMDIHISNAHAGATWCTVEARKKYWIPKAKRLVTDIIKQCGNCRVFHLKPAEAKQGIPPTGRINRSHPFKYVGTDVAGPLFIK